MTLSSFTQIECTIIKAFVSTESTDRKNQPSTFKYLLTPPKKLRGGHSNSKLIFQNLIFLKLCELHQQKTVANEPSYFPLYWLVNRDPYHGLSKSPNSLVV